MEPVIASNGARVGIVYWMDEFNRLSGRTYAAAVGSGQPGEIILFPLLGLDGVQSYEMDSLIEARAHGKALPSNEMTDQILKHARPAGPTLIRSQGSSFVMPGGGDNHLYWRQSGSRWRFIKVE